MKKLLYISILIFLLSCTKGGGNMYVEGKAYNPATGDGIEGIQIRLWKELPPTTLYGGGPNIQYVETTYTDADGNYKIKHTGIFQTFYLKATAVGDRYPIGWVDISTKKKNYADVIPLNSVKMIKSKNMHADFQAVSYGKIAIHIKNNSCFDINDNIKLYFDGEEYNTRTFNPGLYTELNGCVDITDSPVKSAMGHKYFHWEVTKNNIVTTYYDTIFINDIETFMLNVFY